MKRSAVYHLHTDANSDLGDIASRVFDGFTINQGSGYWKGQSEPSATIEVITDQPSKVERLARLIKVENHQEAVLVERTAVKETLV